MKYIFKKKINLILAILITVSLMPVSVFADNVVFENVESENVVSDKEPVSADAITDEVAPGDDASDGDDVDDYDSIDYDSSYDDANDDAKGDDDANGGASDFVSENCASEADDSSEAVSENVVSETDDSNEAVSENTVSEIDGLGAGTKNYSYTNNGLTFNVAYPETITCGTPTRFNFSVTGGSGSYKYRIHSVFTYDGSDYVDVYDVSMQGHSSYDTQDYYDFTFYTSDTYYIRFSAMDYGCSPMKTINTAMFGIKLDINDVAYPSVAARVATLKSQCEAACSTDYEKAVWMNDWLVDHAVYDGSLSYCSAEGVLARGTGTCESYHRAYVMLLNSMGIETGRIVGNGHVWTAVKLDGKWCQMDVTWNDDSSASPGLDLKHFYFGLDDKIMALVHNEHTPKAAYPCNSLENNYFIKYGGLESFESSVRTKIQNKLDSGETSFEIDFSDSLPDGYKDVIYNIVCYKLAKDTWSFGGTDYTLELQYQSCTYPNSKITVTGTKVESNPDKQDNPGIQDNPVEKNTSVKAGKVKLLKVPGFSSKKAKKIKWKSSKKSVASVVRQGTKGKVTAKKAGTAIITGYYNGKVVIRYKVKVTGKKKK